MSEEIPLRDLPTPCLLLDLDVLERNLRRMAGRARDLGVALRPHIKTHKCVEIAEGQIALGAAGLTVSTLEEARAFAAAGFTDLTWAFPVILNRLVEVAELAERATLRLVADGPEAVAALAATAEACRPLHVWLKVDCGYHRAGVDPASEEAVELAAVLAGSPRLIFDGLLTHSGHAYHEYDRDVRRAVAEEERRVMVELAERLRGRGIPVPAVSVGSTPAMSVVEDLGGVTEIRPGNYAFHDFTQVALGSCEVRDCALTVLASVVSAGAGRAVVDAGALALSKDAGPPATAERPATWGEIFASEEDYAAGRLHPELRLTALSQEHGILSRRRPPGERLRVLPNHSCLAAACFDHYHAVRGDRALARWKIHRGR